MSFYMDKSTKNGRLTSVPLPVDKFAFVFIYIFIYLFIDVLIYFYLVCHIHHEGTGQLGNSWDQQMIYCTLSENTEKTLKPKKSLKE